MKATKAEGHGSKTYQLYVDAFDRLKAGMPTIDRLVELQEERGFVLVTQDNVAIEAGLDRKAISGTKCRYPKLAAEIRAARSTHGVVPTTTEQMDTLREDLKIARQLVVATRSKLAEEIIRNEALETRLAEESSLTKRLRAELAKHR